MYPASQPRACRGTPTVEAHEAITRAKTRDRAWARTAVLTISGCDVKRIVEHCVKAGAKTVYVFDHTCNNHQRCYANSGIEDAAKAAGATIVPAHAKTYYKDISIAKAEVLKSVKVHEKILESDVFINVPVLKHHGSSHLSVAMKNLMGIVWDRGFYHGNGLHQCIADFCLFRKPDLNIVDAYRVTMRNEEGETML